MDRKEAIEILKEYRRYALREAITEALDLAIEALGDAESATTTDCISRQQAIEVVANHFMTDALIRNPSASNDIEDWKKIAKGVLSKVPPVTPTERTGEWAAAYLDHESVGVRPRTLYCSECNWLTSFPSAWCPNCGAKMKGGTE